MISQVISGRYTLLGEIGRGGMGAVYRGEDELLHRPVALKRIGFAPEGAGEGAPDTVRAEREARLAAMINHPHVVSVYDLVEAEDRQWLVMEYVDGTALSTLLEREGALSGEHAARLLAQAADALGAAHHAGIVHRDVKPSNMLVTTDGQVKISDFGIARSEADASLTRTGMVTGSPAYLAPEVASGSSANAASDVWSLGATLYHAVTGRTPYAVGDNVLGTLYRIVNEEPPRLPPGDRLAPLLTHMMATDPARRWSMAQVRDYLRGQAAPTGDATQTMPAPPASFLDDVTAPDEPATTRTGSARASHAAAPDRSRVLPAVVVGLAVLLVALLGVGFLLLGGDDGDDAADPGPSAPGTSATPDDQSPSPSDTPSAAPTPQPDAGEMVAFAEGYLGTVTTDPTSSWEQLTPDFQQESGGYGQYSGFWAGYESAAPREVRADPDALTVSYTVDYVLTGGEELTDQVTLDLAFDEGTYRIAGES